MKLPNLAVDFADNSIVENQFVVISVEIFNCEVSYDYGAVWSSVYGLNVRVVAAVFADEYGTSRVFDWAIEGFYVFGHNTDVLGFAVDDDLISSENSYRAGSYIDYDL